MRGLAAFAVMLLHYSEFIYPQKLVPSAYLAVDLFFALSGFVIAYAYDDLLADGMSFWLFLKVRLVRLYPLYVAGTLIGFAFVLLRNVMEPSKQVTAQELALSAIRSLLFLPDFKARSNLIGTFPYDQPAWSLSFEIFINLLYALAHRWLTVRRLAVVVAATGIALAAYVVRAGSLDIGMTPDTFLGGCLRAGFSFSAGVLLYRSKLPVNARSSIIAPLTLLGLAALFAARLHGGARIAFDLTCAALVFPALLLLTARAPLPRPLAPLLVWAGTISYPIYILHVPLVIVLKWITRQIFKVEAAQLTPGVGIAYMVIVLTAASLSVVLYERPIRAWLGRGERLRRRAPADSAQLVPDQA